MHTNVAHLLVYKNCYIRNLFSQLASKGISELPELMVCYKKYNFELIKSAGTKFTSWSTIVYWKLHWLPLIKSGGLIDTDDFVVLVPLA